MALQLRTRRDPVALVEAPSRRPRAHSIFVAPRATPAGAVGLGTLGAVAVGALAIGRLAIGKIGVGRARIKRLEIDELIVRRLTVLDDGEPRR
jgi:hypothetical protein